MQPPDAMHFENDLVLHLMHNCSLLTWVKLRVQAEFALPLRTLAFF